jgi:hypothetical protein
VFIDRKEYKIKQIYGGPYLVACLNRLGSSQIPPIGNWMQIAITIREVHIRYFDIFKSYIKIKKQGNGGKAKVHLQQEP